MRDPSCWIFGCNFPISRAWACTCLPEPVCVCLRKFPDAHFQLYEILLNGHRSFISCWGISPAAPSSSVTGVSSGQIQGPPIRLISSDTRAPGPRLLFLLPLQASPPATPSAACAQRLRQDSHLGREREMWPRRVLSGQRDVLKAFRIRSPSPRHPRCYTNYTEVARLAPAVETHSASVPTTFWITCALAGKLRPAFLKLPPDIGTSLDSAHLWCRPSGCSGIAAS